MANAVYPLFKQSLLTEADANKSLNQTGSNAPYASLITTASGYTYSASHQFYTSLTNIVGTPQPITTPTVVNGTFDGDDVTFTAVSGTVVGAIVIYRQNAGANTTWRLVLYEDTSVTGLPVTPNGGNIVITWNASGIFTLSDADTKHSIRSIGHIGPAEIVSYCYRGETEPRVGLIAQQVESFAPHAVRKIGSHKHVNYPAAFEAALAA
jgi:endosialidase-like protein